MCPANSTSSKENVLVTLLKDLAGGLVDFSGRLVRRSIIWAVALIFAFLSPGISVGLQPSFNDFIQGLSRTPHPGDVWLATVAMLVLGGSDVGDSILSRREKSINGFIYALSWILFVAMGFIVAGIAFISQKDPSPQPPTHIVLYFLAVSLAAEMLVALAPE